MDVLAILHEKFFMKLVVCNCYFDGKKCGEAKLKYN